MVIKLAFKPDLGDDVIATDKVTRIQEARSYHAHFCQLEWSSRFRDDVIATDKVYKNARGTPIPHPNPPAHMAIMKFNFVDSNLT